MRLPIRIKATAHGRPVSYIHRASGGCFRCTIKNSDRSDFRDAELPDTSEFRLALEDCGTGEQALAVVQRFGSPQSTYVLEPLPERDDTAIGVLTWLEGELRWLNDVQPDAVMHIDPAAIECARTIISREPQQNDNRTPPQPGILSPP